MHLALGTRIVLLAVAGPLALSLLLCGWLVQQRVQEVHGELDRRSAIIFQQLTAGAREAIRSGDRSALRRLTATALRDPAVAEVAILTAQDQPLVRSQQLADERAAHWMPGWLSGLLLGDDARRNFREPILPPRMLSQLSTPLNMAQEPLGWLTLDMDGQVLLEERAGGLLLAVNVTLFGGLLLLGLGLLARHAVTAPIRRLTEIVQRLGAGDLGARVQLLSRGELGDLARAINRAAISMERSQERLNQQVEQATNELRETLEAVEIQNVQLDIARKRAEGGSRVKSEFLANMSHEIRTPINGILGFANLLSHSRLDHEQRDYVRTIEESCANLLSLVSDILDFSRMEAGKLIIDSCPFNLRDCVEEVVALMAPAAYKKNLELTQLLYSDVPLHLHGDPVRIRQILTNLIHNAVKFTTDGRITVRVMVEEETTRDALLRITVTDTGIGIPSGEQGRLFDPLGQTESSGIRQNGGAGLGLVICRKLVEQMDGEIGVDSAPEQGSTFWFTLRCQRQADPVTEETPGDNPLRDRKVLLYDPDKLSRLAIRHSLTAWGMQVVEAGSVDEMLAGLRAAEPPMAGVLGLDRLALGDGTCQRLVARLPEDVPPLVALASTVDGDSLRALLADGAAVALPRTARRQTLYRELVRLLVNRHSRAETDQEPAAPVPQRQGAVCTGLRALVVDDNNVNRKLLTTILGRHGATVDQAVDGREAVDLAASRHYHLIFMDIHMPTMSGETAIHLIREQQQERGRHSRIVALTANALSGARQRLKELGVDECLIKPVSEGQVLAQAGAARPLHPTGTTAQSHGGDRSNLTSTLQRMLLAELPTHRQAIQRSYREGDLDALREAVHKLHGGASVSNLPELNTACYRLETILMTDERIRIPEAADQLLTCIDDLLAATQP